VLSFDSAEIAECVARTGFDWLWIDMEHGAIGLAGSLGVPGQLQPGRVVEAIETVRRACEVQGLAAGIFWAGAEAARTQVAAGFSLVAAGTDALLLATGAAALSAGLGKGG
jgi:2-keto-3-deoxy-L-rhamnonate aldolase RhmA